MPGSSNERSRNGLALLLRTYPSAVTYGFSMGLMSMARPYACCDQVVPAPRAVTTGRQLNPAV
jgi:hypothetical protein